MTLLEAVNRYIRFHEEAPVNTIAESAEKPLIAVEAITAINEASKEVQIQGLSANTEYDVDLTRDASNNILVPSNQLSVETNADSSVNPVVRGNKLYDLKNHTDVFTKDLKAKIIYELDFEDLTYWIQNFIVALAIRDSVTDDREQLQVAQVRYIAAKNKFAEKETDVQNTNIFTSSEYEFVDYGYKTKSYH